MRRRGLLGEAEAMFLASLAQDPAQETVYYDLGCVLDDLGRNAEAQHRFEQAYLLKSHFTDAINCLVAMELRKKKPNIWYALSMAKRVLAMDADDSVALCNAGSALRRAGKAQEGIALATSYLEQRTQFKLRELRLKQEQERDIPGRKKIKFAIICIKWGKKYGSNYVNNLFGGCKRNILKSEFAFFCFTDDENGIDKENIHVLDLPSETWDGWWCKPSILFSGHLEKCIPQQYDRFVYIDLDTVIVGPLDDILQNFHGRFGVLGTGEFSETECRENGYNTSIMIFHHGDAELKHVLYAQLETLGISELRKVVQRFDFWVEMTVLNADILQNQFPGKLIDFKTHVKHKSETPRDAAIVNFPLKPKPHQVDAEWIKQHWRP